MRTMGGPSKLAWLPTRRPHPFGCSLPMPQPCTPPLACLCALLISWLSGIGAPSTPPAGPRPAVSRLRRPVLDLLARLRCCPERLAVRHGRLGLVSVCGSWGTPLRHAWRSAGPAPSERTVGPSCNEAHAATWLALLEVHTYLLPATMQVRLWQLKEPAAGVCGLLLADLVRPRPAPCPAPLLLSRSAACAALFGRIGRMCACCGSSSVQPGGAHSTTALAGWACHPVMSTSSGSHRPLPCPPSDPARCCRHPAGSPSSAPSSLTSWTCAAAPAPASAAARPPTPWTPTLPRARRLLVPPSLWRLSEVLVWRAQPSGSAGRAPRCPAMAVCPCAPAITFRRAFLRSHGLYGQNQTTQLLCL